MKDWQGNIIKVGDIIQLYQFEELFAGGIFTFGFITEEGFDKIGEYKSKKHSQWLLLQTFKVVEPLNDGCITILHWTNDVENPKECPIDSLGWNVTLSNNHAVCIKGVSDNELDHFLHYKNIVK